MVDLSTQRLRWRNRPKSGSILPEYVNESIKLRLINSPFLVSNSHTFVEDPFPIDPPHASDDMIRRVNPLEDGQWDGLLGANPSASFFHSRAWASVLRETYGFSPTYFTLRRPGSLQSLLPAMEVNSWLTGRRGVSLPFTDECAPLLQEPDSFQTLFDHALAYAKLRKWRYLECRCGQPLRGAFPSKVFAGHRLSLSESESTLYSHCDGSVRQAIRKAERSGLTVEFSQDLEALMHFYHLLCETRKRHGVLPHPRAFFLNIHRYALNQNFGWVALAKLGTVPIAGAVFFHLGETAIFKYGASDKRFQALRPNNLIMWEAIKRYSAQGVATLDFGRTSFLNKGLLQFKRGWGVTEHKIEYVKFDVQRNRFVTSCDESHRWHNRVVETLPAPFLRWIGAALYKHAA